MKLTTWAGGLAWLRYRLDMAGMSGNIEQGSKLNSSEGDHNNPNNETISWELYKDYLSGLTTGDTTNDRISYAKKYYHVLLSGNASELLGQVQRRFVGCFQQNIY